MSYERKDIPALISAFRSVKKRIANRECTYFLCHALEKIESTVRQNAIALVQESLHGSYSLASWIRRTQDPEFDFNSFDCRLLRIRWCAKIIRDLKEYAK